MAQDTQQPPTSTQPDRDTAREPWGWTRRQRIGLGILLAILLAVLVVQFVRRPAHLNEPIHRGPDDPILPQYIDPNTATAAELARIPHMGDALAAKIVDYREARKATARDGIVFHQLSDIAKIPTIGTKTAEEFEPFLKFPESTSQP